MSKNEYFESAMRKVNENDFESAIELFTKALAEVDQPKDVLYNRAVAYLNSKQIDLAIYDFSKLIEIDSTNAFYYTCRAFAKSRGKDKKGAIADYEISIKLEPNNPITHNNMGLVQEELGYMQQAQKSFAQSDDLRKKEEANKILNSTTDKAIQKEVDQRIEQAKKMESAETVENKSKGQIAKEVFTDKNTFKEFLKFIKNGFKIKE